MLSSAVNVILLLSLSAANSYNIVQDPSFEEVGAELQAELNIGGIPLPPADAVGSGFILKTTPNNTGWVQFGKWVGFNGRIKIGKKDYPGLPLGKPLDGNYFLDLNPEKKSSIGQWINLVAGTYHLKIDVSMNTNCNEASTKTANIRILDFAKNYEPVEPVDTPGGMSISSTNGQLWETRTIKFKALSEGYHWMDINSDIPGKCGILLDNIVLEQEQSVNLIKNPSFESGSQCAGNAQECEVPQDSIQNWQSAGDNIALVSFKKVMTDTGLFSVSLATHVFQKVSLIAGKVYTLSVSVFKNNCAGANDGKGRVRVIKAGTIADVVEGKGAGMVLPFIATPAWEKKEMTFIFPEDGDYNFIFQSDLANSCGPVIDSITLREIEQAVVQPDATVAQTDDNAIVLKRRNFRKQL